MSKGYGIRERQIVRIAQVLSGSPDKLFTRPGLAVMARVPRDVVTRHWNYIDAEVSAMSNGTLHGFRPLTFIRHPLLRNKYGALTNDAGAMLSTVHRERLLVNRMERDMLTGAGLSRLAGSSDVTRAVPASLIKARRESYLASFASQRAALDSVQAAIEAELVALLTP